MKGAVFLGLVAAVVAWMVSITQKEATEGEPSGTLPVALGIGGAIALALALPVVRVAARWLVTRAGIWLEEGRLRFALPVPRRFVPLVRVEETSVTLTDVQDTGFACSAERAPLRLVSTSGEVAVPSGAFALGPLGLEDEVRALAGLPTFPRSEWVARARLRVVMLVVGITLMLGPFLAAGLPGAEGIMEVIRDLLPSAAVGIVLLTPGAVGLGLVLLSGYYRGRVVLDARGLFHERGGVASFVAWEDLPGAKTSYDPGLLFDSLEVKTTSGEGCRIALNRIVGLGFPLPDIRDALATVSPDA